MKKITTSLLVSSLTLLCACNNDKLNYYNQLVDINDSIRPYRMAFSKEASRGTQADSTILIKTIEAFAPHLKDGIAKIKTVAYTQGGENLKQDFIAVDSIMLVMVSDMKDALITKHSDKEYEAINTKILSNTSSLQKNDSTLQKSIAQFVKENDITLNK
jgi:hypothetical protein